MAEEKAKKPMNPVVKQWVIPVAVLVIICLVCVLLLALCNDLLYVSSEEKFNRTIRKVYDGYDSSVTFKEEKVDSKWSSNDNYGEVLEVRSASDGSFVITSKGTVGAFNGGSVTILVAISPNPEAKILGWALQGNEGQTFIANITEKHQKAWFVGSTVSDVQPNVTVNAGQGKGSGATYTENALANAINMACYYAQNALHLGANPEGDAKDAVLAKLGEEYASYNLNTVNISQATVDGTKKVSEALSDSENKLKYVFVGTGAKGTIFAYVYGEGDNIKFVVVTDDGVVTSENVEGSEEFVANIKANPMYTFTYGSKQAYAIITSVDADTKVYTVAGLKVGTTPNTYVLEITIETDGDHGKVANIAIKAGGDGWVNGDPDATHENANKLIESLKLKGATSATIGSIYDSDKVAGATESANLIRAAVEAALNHYDATLASND